MSVLVPDRYEDTPLADKLHGKLQPFVQGRTQSRSSVTCDWTAVHNDRALDPRLFVEIGCQRLKSTFKDGRLSLGLSARDQFFSPLPQLISEALLLENLVETFGPECLSADGDEYKQNWSFLLLHDSGEASLEFSDYKGMPRMTFRGNRPLRNAAINLVEYLITRPPACPPDESVYRQSLSSDFMLRQTDLEILRDYNKLWRHEDSEAAEQAQGELSEMWEVQAQLHTWAHDLKIAIYRNEEIDFESGNVQPTSAVVNFNTRISPCLLLLRLFHTFGPNFWQGQDRTAWGMTLRHGPDGWIQIQNDGGFLVVKFQGTQEDEKAARELLTHVISHDVITPYDGNIAGRVA